MNEQSLIQNPVSRRNFLRGAALFGIGLSGINLAGCSSGGGAAAGKKLVISQPASPRFLDPIAYTGVYESQIINSVCDTLVEYKMDLSEIVPSLATKWTVSDDALTYTFDLRDDVVFQPGEYQDGRAVTAEDIKYSLERSAYESSMNRLSMLDHCNVISDTQIECVLKAPAASFLTALTDAGNSIVPKEEVEGWGDDFGSHLVGSGPFKLDSFVLDQQADLVRHDAFWGPEPLLDAVTIRVITDMNQAANALATGEVHLALSLTGESCETVRNTPELELRQTEGLHVAYIYFNQVNGPTADQDVRRAILMAIDRAELVKGIYPYGEAAEAKVPLPKGSWGYDASVEDLVPAYDPAAAKDLLTKAGYPDGFTMSLHVSNTEARQRLATIVKQMLAENLNINVDIHLADWGTFSEAAASGTADMYGMSWTWYPDPYFFLDKLFSSSEIGALGNGAGFSNPEVDDLLAKANAATEQDVRADFYKQALRKIVEQDPMLVYASEYVNDGVSNKVQGYVQRADNKALICNEQVNISLA